MEGKITLFLTLAGSVMYALSQRGVLLRQNILWSKPTTIYASIRLGIYIDQSYAAEYCPKLVYEAGRQRGCEGELQSLKQLYDGVVTSVHNTLTANANDRFQISISENSPAVQILKDRYYNPSAFSMQETFKKMTAHVHREYQEPTMQESMPHIVLLVVWGPLSGNTEIKRQMHFNETAVVCVEKNAPYIAVINGRQLLLQQLLAIYAVGFSLGINFELCAGRDHPHDGLLTTSTSFERNIRSRKENYIFSCCALHRIYNALRYPTRTCLVDKQSIVKELNMRRYYPNDVMTPDYTCARNLNILVRYLSCQPTVREECLSLYCQTSVEDRRCNIVNASRQLLDGTKCKPGYVCQFGQCVPEASLNASLLLPLPSCNLNLFCPHGYFFCPSNNVSEDPCIRDTLICGDLYRECLTEEAKACCEGRSTTSCTGPMRLSKFRPVYENTLTETDQSNTYLILTIFGSTSCGLIVLSYAIHLLFSKGKIRRSGRNRSKGSTVSDTTPHNSEKKKRKASQAADKAAAAKFAGATAGAAAGVPMPKPPGVPHIPPRRLIQLLPAILRLSHPPVHPAVLPAAGLPLPENKTKPVPGQGVSSKITPDIFFDMQMKRLTHRQSRQANEYLHGQLQDILKRCDSPMSVSISSVSVVRDDSVNSDDNDEKDKPITSDAPSVTSVNDSYDTK